jgi:ABC-type nickel/cobalt efflux system permease component RcnA
MKRLLLALALLLGALAGSAQAHIVPVGVGTQTWFDIRPRRILVQFNLGFSSLLGLKELHKADADRDGYITQGEVDAYLEKLGGDVLPHLRFLLDKQPLSMHVVRRTASNMVGPLTAVPFETYFILEADVSVSPGTHELSYYEGSYENEISQQLLHISSERKDDFGEFYMEQQAPSEPTESDGNFELKGRDVLVRYSFLPKAIERDKAEALLEPSMAGMQETLDAVATTVARATETDLAKLPTGTPRLGVTQGSPLLLPHGFSVGAPTAQGRSTAPMGSTPGASVLENETTKQEQEMFAEAKKPFAFMTLLVFLLWGMIHAKGPGHGKMMVSAYLAGTRGRVWDAVRLGAIVTFTHTFTLYTFGLGLVYLVERWKLTHSSQQAVMTRAMFLLSLFSGVTIVLYGLGLTIKRWRTARRQLAARPVTVHVHLPEKLEAPGTGKRLGLVAAAPVEVAADHHHHDHDHDHDHDHAHDHDHGDGHTHGHSHGDMTDDEHAAFHAREAAQGISSLKDLILVGVQGGLVPCPAGVFLIVSSLTYQENNTLRAFAYLSAFSIGLGSVLVGIAVMVVLSRSVVATTLGAEKNRRFVAWAPVAGALALTLAGGLVGYEAFDPSLKAARTKVASLLTTAK